MKLPDAGALQTHIASPQTSQVNAGSNINLQQAFGKLGQSVQGYAEQKSQKRSKFEYAEALADLEKRKLEADSVYSNDRDYEDLEKRYDEHIRKEIDSSAKLITNKENRAKFMLDADVTATRGRLAMRERADGVERDVKRATANDALNTYNRSVIQGDVKPEEAHERITVMLEGGVEAGYYSAEEAGKIEHAWMGQTAADKISALPFEERKEALSQEWSSYLTPAARRQIIDQIEIDEREDKALNIVDDMYYQGLDLKEMNREIRKIEDTDLRKEVERRRDYVNTRDEQALAQAGEKFYEDYGMSVLMGEMDFSQIPRDALDQMSLSQVSSLKNAAAAQLAKGGRKQSDLKAYAQVKEHLVNGNHAKAQNLIWDNIDKFTHSDAKSLINEVVKKPDDVKIKSTRSLSETINQTLRNAGMKDDAATRGELWEAYDKMALDYQVANDGALPPPDMIQKELENFVVKQRIEKRGLFNDVQKRRYEIEKLDSIPQEHIQSVLSVLPETIKVGDAQAYYNDALLMFSNEGITDPTPEEISAMIAARRTAAGR